MRNSRSIIFVSVLCLFFAGFLITSCMSRTPAGEAVYYQAPSKPALSSQQRANLTEADIKELIKRGDAEYAAGRYSVAKDIYYEVLLATPNPSVDVLISYGACLARLQAYENAIDIFNVALEKDPGNATAKGNIAVCRQRLAEQSEAQRKLVLQQQQQQQENFNNLIASLNAAGEFAGQVQNNRGGGQAPQNVSTGGNTGGQSSGGSSVREDRHIANNPAAARNTYKNWATAAKDYYNILDKAYKTDSSSATQSHKSRIKELEKNLKDCQDKMRDFREEAGRQGVDIRKDEYETKWPRP